MNGGADEKRVATVFWKVDSDVQPIAVIWMKLFKLRID